MNKGVIIAAIVLAVILALGITECVFLKKNYTTLAKELELCIEKAQNEALTKEECDALEDMWVKIREKSELFLPHADIHELNLRIFEGTSNTRNGDYKQATVHFSVAKMLAEYVPQLVRPYISHIV